MDRPPPLNEREPRRLYYFRLIGFSIAWICFTLCLLLWFTYRFVGDTTPWGEAFTTVPPIVWTAPLAFLAIPSLLARSPRALGLVAAGIMLLVSQDDLDSLFIRSGSWDKKTDARVITWNIAGQSDWTSVLRSLEPWEPDIIFLQETPDGDASLSTRTLTGYWRGFSWLDQGDCGILSRYPLIPQETEKIGPWDKPALAIAEVGVADEEPGIKVLLSSIRLMMPANTIYPGYVPDVHDHESRVRQYSNLAKLLKVKQQESGADAIVAGGDFNVRGGSASLKPLTEAGIQDVWLSSGSGWGATILADFPVARIDQVRISGCFPVKSRTAVGKYSDHRMVITDLDLEIGQRLE